MAHDTRVRISLWFLIVGAVGVGMWAQFFPHAFYNSFPGFGRSWVSVDGPFNEHLIRDGIEQLAQLGHLAPFPRQHAVPVVRHAGQDENRQHRI